LSSLHYSYLVSRESYLAKIIEAKAQNRFVSRVALRKRKEVPLFCSWTCPFGTVQELLDSGITEEKFEEVTGFKVPDKKSVSLRDFIIEKGFEFGEIKDKFAE